MIDSAKTVLETIKVTARLSRTEQEAIDFAIEELGKKEDLLETIQDIKDNVYQQGRADREKELSELPNEYSEKLWKIAYQKGKTNGAREFAEWLANGCSFMRRLGEDDMHTVDELISEWQKGAENDVQRLQ